MNQTSLQVCGGKERPFPGSNLPVAYEVNVFLLTMDITVFGQLILITSIRILNVIDVSRHS
jgi:hypothetical protein